MKVGIITPYYNEINYIDRCIQSVQAIRGVETFQCIVCDGTPVPRDAGPGREFIKLVTNYNDVGCTPRYVAAMELIRRGCDYLAFLDADNWFYPEHLEVGIEKIKKNNVDFVCSRRMLYSLDEQPIGPCLHVVGGKLVDTNCLILTPSCFDYMSIWVTEGPKQAPIADQLFARGLLKAGKKMAATTDITVGYRSRYAVHYRMHNRVPPPGAV